jgi:DNA topoisomerase-1
VGLITYMRTDSVRVADSALAQVRDFIGAKFDARYLPATANVHKSGRGGRVQDAHEAIRPTDVARLPEGLKASLDTDLFKLYQLIWLRFVASQMAASEYETTTVDFDLGRMLFRSTGSRVLFDGFRALYHEGHEAGESADPEELAPIPKLAEGDIATVRAITPSQHFTEPPPRYSQASLVKALEEKGIGRPSTYATIIGTLQDRWYATTKDRRFSPTPQGEKVWKAMRRCFPEVFEVGFTAQMETELDKVEEGELRWQQVLGDFWGPFATALAAVDVPTLIREVHDVSDLHTQSCPNCGGPLEVRSGRFGPFIACAKYPECKFSKPIGRDRVPDRPTDQKCRECGGDMVIKTGRYGEFLACKNFPKCTHTRPVPLGVKCPKCGVGDLVEKRAKRRGRTFYGCDRYQADGSGCDFTAWNKPVPVPCPECGFVGMEHRETKTAGTTRKCLKCGHEMTLAETDGAESDAA